MQKNSSKTKNKSGASPTADTKKKSTALEKVFYKLAKPGTSMEELEAKVTLHKEEETARERQEEDEDSESDDSWTRPPVKCNTIREFFDHMKKEPRDLDGLGLETLIRDVVNNEVSSLRA